MRHIDRRPRERDGSVDERTLGGGRHAVRGELGLMVDGRQRFDANRRMNRGNDLRDVPHVARSGSVRQQIAAVGKPAPERGRVSRVHARKLPVVAHLRVRRVRREHAESGTGRVRTGFEAALHARLRLGELCERAATHHVTRVRALRDAAEMTPALQGHPVYPVGGPQILPQEADRDLRDRECALRVDAFVRGVERIGAAARVLDVNLRKREQWRLEHVHRRWMDEHRGMDAVEPAAIEKDRLAVALLLGRGPDHRNPEPELARDLTETDRDADRGRRDQVVAAGVPDLRKRVVFRADGEMEVSGARPAYESGREITRASLDREPGVFERLGEPSRRARLGEAELRIRVNLSAELDEARRMLDDRELRAPFRFRDGEREIVQAAAPRRRLAGSRKRW